MNVERLFGYALIWICVFAGGTALAIVLGADMGWAERVEILAPCVPLTWAAAKGLSVDGRWTRE